MKSFSHVQLFATPWTVVYQAPLSMGFSWQECWSGLPKYTEEVYKKDLHDPENHGGVITHTHLETDIVECEVKWALGGITMNKASGGVMEFQLSYFKS